VSKKLAVRDAVDPRLERGPCSVRIKALPRSNERFLSDLFRVIDAPSKMNEETDESRVMIVDESTRGLAVPRERLESF